MPNLITHKIFAEEVLQRLQNKSIQHIIQNNEQLYYIGSNGPDPLFFYGAAPWNLFQENFVSDIGNALHCGHVNTFYLSAIHQIQKQKHIEIKERMLTYLFGHICHWAIDSSTHPYIYYRTGDCTGMSLNYHHRFESILDETVLRTYRNKTIKEFHFPDICLFDTNMLQAIARIYVPVIKEIFHSNLRVYDIRKALQGWHAAQTWLYDPKHIKIDAWSVYESIHHNTWQMSGNIVPNRNENDIDVMNENHVLWKHPCDDTLTSNTSFPDMFDAAINLAVDVIQTAYQCIHKQLPESSITSLLKDCAYDTGMSGFRKMRHFDIVFEK